MASVQQQKRALEQTMFALEDAEAELIWRRRLPDVDGAIVASNLEHIRAKIEDIEAKLNMLDATGSLNFPGDDDIRRLGTAIEELRRAIARSAGVEAIIAAVGSILAMVN